MRFCAVCVRLSAFSDIRCSSGRIAAGIADSGFVQISVPGVSLPVVGENAGLAGISGERTQTLIMEQKQNLNFICLYN